MSCRPQAGHRTPMSHPAVNPAYADGVGPHSYNRGPLPHPHAGLFPSWLPVSDAVPAPGRPPFAGESPRRQPGVCWWASTPMCTWALAESPCGRSPGGCAAWRRSGQVPAALRRTAMSSARHQVVGLAGAKIPNLKTESHAFQRARRLVGAVTRAWPWWRGSARRARKTRVKPPWTPCITYIFAGASALPRQETVVGKSVHWQTDGAWARRRKHLPGVGPVRPATRRACRGGMLRGVRARRSGSSSRERSSCRQALKYPCRQTLL